MELVGVTILVVDDDEAIRDLARRHLEKAGFEVETFDTVDGGLARLRTAPQPGAILLDGILPERDGWDFLQAIAKDTSLPSVPIVLMSDLVDLTQSAMPARVKIAGRLDKPFNAQSLTKAIQ